MGGPSPGGVSTYHIDWKPMASGQRLVSRDVRERGVGGCVAMLSYGSSSDALALHLRSAAEEDRSSKNSGSLEGCICTRGRVPGSQHIFSSRCGSAPTTCGVEHVHQQRSPDTRPKPYISVEWRVALGCVSDRAALADAGSGLWGHFTGLSAERGDGYGDRSSVAQATVAFAAGAHRRWCG